MEAVGICSITRFKNSRVVGSVQCKSQDLVGSVVEGTPQEYKQGAKWRGGLLSYAAHLWGTGDDPAGHDEIPRAVLPGCGV